MTNANTPEGHEIGMVGLGTMGRNFLLNLADHGFSGAGYDQDAAKVAALTQEAAAVKGAPLRGAATLAEFVALLRKPRAVMMLVPAGAPVDAVIGSLLEHLEPGDLIIDGGNSFFKDTDLRARKLAETAIHFMGVGISGGEEGARKGPSLMPGGPPEAYERIRPLFEASAARVNGEACVAYLGPGSAGHYVKMVHNGIEYAIMQIIAEAYDLMRRGLGMSNDEVYEFFAGWAKGELGGYLMEITAEIFARNDDKTGQRLIDEIRAVANQNGTGMWASESAMDLLVPTPMIDAAVAMRNLSALEAQRRGGSGVLLVPKTAFAGDRDAFLAQLPRALCAGMIIAYAQGMALLAAASDKFGYRLDLEAVARIWRGGCIIRSTLLDQIRSACRNPAARANPLLDPDLAKLLVGRQADLRRIVSISAELGLPSAALMAGLSYLDGYRSAWLPANLIQAQRDYFGAHTYERIDEKGKFHTQWQKP